MNWASLIPLIVQVGLPLAERIWQKANSGKVATQEDWDELREIEAKTPEVTLRNLATRAGVPMDDPRIVALAALIQPAPPAPIALPEPAPVPAPVAPGT